MDPRRQAGSSNCVFFAAIWEAKDWTTTDVIIAKFRDDLAKHPVQPDQTWVIRAQRLVHQYEANQWHAVEANLNAMKADQQFAKEYTRTKNTSQRHGDDARRLFHSDDRFVSQTAKRKKQLSFLHDHFCVNPVAIVHLQQLFLSKACIWQCNSNHLQKATYGHV